MFYEICFCYSYNRVFSLSLSLHFLLQKIEFATSHLHEYMQVSLKNMVNLVYFSSASDTWDAKFLYTHTNTETPPPTYDLFPFVCPFLLSQTMR